MLRLGVLIVVLLGALAAAGSSAAQETPTCFSFDLGQNVPATITGPA